LKHAVAAGGDPLGLSPPARGRGLKLSPYDGEEGEVKVAPRTGAWIETTLSLLNKNIGRGRPPHGGVD